MSTTSNKNETTSHQEHSSFDDLKHSTYNRFRAKDKEIIEFQEKFHSLHEYEKKPFMLDLLSKQVQATEWKTLNESELEYYLQSNPLVSLSDIHFKKKKRKTIKESLNDLVDIVEIKEIKLSSKTTPGVVVLEAKNIKKEKLNHETLLPKTNQKTIVEISLCSSDSECEQTNKKQKPKTLEQIPTNANTYISQDTETQANFLDNELEMNIIPSENNIEALLDHFSDESVAKSNNESMCVTADEYVERIELTNNLPMANIENTLVSKASEKLTATTNNSSNEHFEFFNSKLQEIFQKKLNSLKSNDLIKKEMNKSKLESLVLNINKQVLSVLNPKGDTYSKYYNKMCKIKNMIDSEFNRNGRFYYKLLSGKLTPETLAKMSDEELKQENELENGLINIEDEFNDAKNNNTDDHNANEVISEEDVPLGVLSKKLINSASQEKKISQIASDKIVPITNSSTNLTSLKINNDTEPRPSTEISASTIKINHEKSKTMFLADSSDEEEDEQEQDNANIESEGALPDSDTDEEHNILITKNTYQWCVCENSFNHKNSSEMCDKCKTWYHKECISKHFAKTTTYHTTTDGVEFNCFACNTDMNLIKKYYTALTKRKHPNAKLVNTLESQTNGDQSSSSEHSSDTDDIGGKKKTKKTTRNFLLDSSSSSLATNESLPSNNSSSSSSDSDSEINTKKRNGKTKPENKVFKLAPRIEISDLNININKNDNKPKINIQPDKRKETQKLNDKERIEKLKNKLKPANQTKLLVSSDVMRKKTHRNHNDSNAKLSTPTASSSSSTNNSKSTENLNSKKNATVAKIKQNFLKERGLDELFTRPIILNKKPNPINPPQNNSNNKTTNSPSIPKLNTQTNNKIKPLASSSSSTTTSVVSSLNKPPVQLANTFEACRPNFRKSLKEKLMQKMEKNPKAPVLLQPELEIRIGRIEAELYKYFNNNLKNYRTQCRSILHNVQDPKNDTFYLKVLTDHKGYMPEDLPKMSNDDMASDERIEERKKERQNEIEQIEKYVDEENLKKASMVNLKNSEKGLPQVYVEEFKELLEKTKNNSSENTKVSNQNNEIPNQDLDNDTCNLNKSPRLPSSSSSVSLSEKKLITSPLLTSKSIDFSTPAFSFITEPNQLVFAIDYTDLPQHIGKDTSHQHREHVFDINCKYCTKSQSPKNSPSPLTSPVIQDSLSKTQISDQVSSTVVNQANLAESCNLKLPSPTVEHNKNINFSSNDNRTKKNEMDSIENGPKPVHDIREKSSNIESQQKEKLVAHQPIPTQKNPLHFNSNIEKSPPSTEPKNNSENIQANLIKNKHSLISLSPTFQEDLNHSPRSFTGSLTNEPITNIINESKERMVFEPWGGSIDFANSSLCVKGYPVCGKGMEFYNELKERFLNKKLTKLLVDAKSAEHMDLKIEKTIFHYLGDLSCDLKRELVFIKFESEKSGKSKINLSGNNWQVMESPVVYNMVFENLKTQADKRVFYKIMLPSEHADFLEDFYLFSMSKKDQNNTGQTYDHYFSRYHNIKIVRKCDYIMGVIIRKERTPLPLLDVNTRKRKEHSAEDNPDEENTKRSKTSTPAAETSSKNSNNTGNTSNTIHLPSSNHETTLQPLVRDPRLIQRSQSQIHQKSIPDPNQKEIPLVSLSTSTSIAPIPELAKEIAVNKELNDASENHNFSVIKDKELKSNGTNSPTSLTNSREKPSETPMHQSGQKDKADKQIEKNTFGMLVEALDLIIEVDDKDEMTRQEQLEGIKNSFLLDDITDEQREKILHAYKEKLPDFVFIILDSSKNEEFKAESIQKLLTKTKKIENLPPAEKWLGTSKEQVLERIRIHKSGLKLSLENENWKKTKKSFELVEPNIEQTNGERFRNTFNSVCDP